MILPLLVNNEIVTDLLDKANMFSDFFREQCRPITSDSTLPSNQMCGTVTNNQMFGTVTRLSNFYIDTDTIIKLIHALDPNKAYRCNGFLIGMIKLCTMSVLKPLHILSNNSAMNECFPSQWKKANIILVHKKVKKGNKKYRPVSTLPICSKILEKYV